MLSRSVIFSSSYLIARVQSFEEGEYVTCITNHKGIILKSCGELLWANSHQKEGENWVHPILRRETVHCVFLLAHFT